MPTLRAGISSSKGYTLIELSVVVLLIGIIMAISFPRAKAFLTRNNIRKSVNEISGAIKYVRNRAITDKMVYRLNYELEKDFYWVTVLVYNEENEAEFRRNPVVSTVLSKKRSLPSGVHFRDVITGKDEKITEGVATTTFLPNGIIENSIIHLQDGYKKDYTLIVQPLTGTIKTQKGYVEQREQKT